MKTGTNHKQHGFTLAELTVVVFVVGIVAGFAFVKFRHAIEVQAYRQGRLNCVPLAGAARACILQKGTACIGDVTLANQVTTFDNSDVYFVYSFNFTQAGGAVTQYEVVAQRRNSAVIQISAAKQPDEVISLADLTCSNCPAGL